MNLILTVPCFYNIIFNCKAKSLTDGMLMNDNIKADPNPLESVEDIHEIVVLLDFYGQLLTKRQFDIMDLHFNSDLSLGEIAEDLGISRQGVYDSIRKAKNLCWDMKKAWPGRAF